MRWKHRDFHGRSSCQTGNRKRRASSPSFADDSVKIRSTRYPFCFYGEPTDPESTRGILEVLPFNAELNRSSCGLPVLQHPGLR